MKETAWRHRWLSVALLARREYGLARHFVGKYSLLAHIVCSLSEMVAISL